MDDILPSVEAKVEGKWKLVHLVVDSEVMQEGVSSLPIAIQDLRFGCLGDVQDNWFDRPSDQRFGIGSSSGLTDIVEGKLALHNDGSSMNMFCLPKPFHAQPSVPVSVASEPSVLAALENMLKYMENLIKKLSPGDVLPGLSSGVICEENHGMPTKRRYGDDDDVEGLDAIICSTAAQGRDGRGRGRGRGAVAKVSRPVKESVRQNSQIANLHMDGDGPSYESDNL